MPKGPGSRALAACGVAWAGHSHGEKKSAGMWLADMSCTVSGGITSNTTHVVAAEKAWKKGHKVIDAAMEENESRAAGKEIKFVSYTWVGDCSSGRTKKSEGPYLCQKIWQAYKTNGQKPSLVNGGEVTGARNQAGMMRETLLESTGQHVDENLERDIAKQLKRQKKQKEAMEQMRREEEQEEAEEEGRVPGAQIFAKGAKKARNDIFTENHHIYMDTTLFKYDVTITKVDTRNNRNERYHLTLQIYESNAEPRTYAFNVQFAGTGLLPSNNHLAAIGTPFPTAFHSFKSYFKEKTGVEWDDRISHAVLRAKTDRRDRGLATQSEAGTRIGVPVAANGEAVRKAKEWKDQVFEYHPPRFGQRGIMPEDKKAELARLAPRAKGASGGGDGRQSVEAWISGGLGGADVPSPTAANGAGQHKGVDGGAVDLTGDENNLEGANHGTSQDTATPPEIPPEQIEDLVDQTFPFDPKKTGDFDFDADIEPAIKSLFSPGANEAFTTEPVTAEEDFSFDLSQFDHNMEPTDAAPEPDFADLLADPAVSTNASQAASFNLPPSTVEESFQPATQEVGETQRAERAMAEFEEGMEQGQFAAELMTGGEQFPSPRDSATAAGELGVPAEAGVQVEKWKGLNLGKSVLGGLNLGSSLLGKRKAEAPVLEEEGEMDEGAKRMKMEEEGFGGGDGERDAGDESYLLDAQLNDGGEGC